MNNENEEASSGSGDDVYTLGSHSKRPSASRKAKRSRKTAGDALVDAMLEIAAVSKARATTLVKNEDRFSSKKCTKAPNKMQGASSDMVDLDMELDKMELVAAAAGYSHYCNLTKQPQIYLLPGGCTFLNDLLKGPKEAFREMFRMDKHVFYKLCNILRQKAMLRDTAGVIIEEQVGIFLNIAGHNERNRVIQERFEHSGETISRHFNNVLKAIKSLSREFLQPPPLSTPQEIMNSKRFHAYFKDCIGVLDGMQIPAHLPAKDQSRFRNRKGQLTQNVLAACTFDLQFIFVYPGWEGSVPDSHVLRAVLTDPSQNFPEVPEGKYYLVDRGYVNTKGFIAPYPGFRYHLHEFRGANQMPRNAKELFNQRHSSLRNAIKKSFNVLKTRFPILKVAPQYAFHVQRDVVIAACVLHNLIRQEDKHDWLFAGVDEELAEDLTELEEELEMQLDSMERESIAMAMWNDFINKWDEW